MGKVNELLTQRLKSSQGGKMAAMAQKSVNGNLTSFAGVFSITDISAAEKQQIEAILKHYAIDIHAPDKDLPQLIALTSEVKSINNQAALLHGERVKKAHTILTRYRDGAFSAWMMAAYGNRQTPYNLMKYYEFCEAMPKALRLRIETMPRQAVYTLATRDGPAEKKQKIVESYHGQTKAELLALIREVFPLADDDKRKRPMGETVVAALQRLHYVLKRRPVRFTTAQKDAVCTLLEAIHQAVVKNK